MYVHLSRLGPEKLSILFLHKTCPLNESQLLQLALH